jgi:hypothetical protein
MAMYKRAAQFAPFAALTGYEEIVQATAKAHEKAVAGGAVFFKYDKRCCDIKCFRILSPAPFLF